MRISDWSSDVCSSDLPWRGGNRGDQQPGRAGAGSGRLARPLFHRTDLSGADAPGDRSGASFPVHPQYRLLARLRSQATLRRRADTRTADGAFDPAALRTSSSEERRVGKECVSQCIYWVSLYHYKKKKLSDNKKT